jgi:hypothetical protein
MAVSPDFAMVGTVKTRVTCMTSPGALAVQVVGGSQSFTQMLV